MNFTLWMRSMLMSTRYDVPTITNVNSINQVRFTVFMCFLPCKISEVTATRDSHFVFSPKIVESSALQGNILLWSSQFLFTIWRALTYQF
uniref:Uncharacterized protein n=1 Tax=Setaria viridis TaxID=4556 RepID=A0A4U6VWR7_SETVI|nr:hypothetical protein SEVIR_2G247900v2 [Setaria viridis]